MTRYLLLTCAFLLAGLGVWAQTSTSLQGKVTDADSGEPIIYGTVALFKNGVLVTGSDTDLDGYYSITELDPGTYDVEFSYTGFQTQRVSGVVLSAGKANKLDVKLSAGVTLQVIEVTWKKPLIEQDNTTQGGTLTSEEIRNLPTRNVNALASLTAGVASADAGGDLNIRGSRSDATNYYLDGIRISGNLIPTQYIEQLQVITGGVEARYGDVTGGIVSVTSKGPSEKFSGGIELESSEFLDAFGHNLASLNVSGPILKKGTKTLLGYRIGGQYLRNKDDDPPATPVYRVKDEVRRQLEAEPVVRVGNALYPAANFVTNSGVDKLKYNPNEARTTIDITGKLDASIGKNVDVTFSGTYYEVDNQFTPGIWQVFNSHNNPTSRDRNYRANVRLRHRLGGATTVTGDGTAPKGALVQNAAYVLQFGYEKNLFDVSDPRHGDNYFNYGYIGKYDLSWKPTLDEEVNPEDFKIDPNDSTKAVYVQGHVDYSRTLDSVQLNYNINPVLARYILNTDVASFDNFNVVNGILPSNLSNVWSNLHTNIGAVYNLNRKRDSDLYTFQANTSFELVPKGSGGARHNIQFGLLYESRVNRGYDVSPYGLWQLARLKANEHIEGQGLDSTSILGYRDGRYIVFDLVLGTITVDSTIQVPIYAPKTTNLGSDNQFYIRLREKFNRPLNEFFNVDGLDPSQLSLDLFSSRELTDQGFVNYWGYDYLGNKIDRISFDNFFKTEVNGVRTFPVPAFRPNYQAAYIQDKFTFKDIIFRLGLRVDRYDANTKVLKDPYSLYDIISAGDFDARFGTTRPGNIGENFKVYVASEGGSTVQAYRDGDTWYFPNGTPANSGTEIFGGGIVFPRYTIDDVNARDITARGFDTRISFEDYKPQVNWMPRLAVSFPISEEANFFAHYDILVQRPPSNTFVSPLTYFYWTTSGSGIRNNANLKPERTVDYEVGFQQKLSNSSALKISAYYKELRDMIQSRFFLHVPSPVNQYQTYDNLDFATVKGFNLQYDLRRTGNISMNIAYTLQFADGTGSDANSSRSLASTGIQRTLFPLNFDERHRIAAIVDYRYGSGNKYNGPSISGVDIFANAGINLTTIAVSGRPYTAAIEPDVLGSRGIIGSINGSRLPWNLTLDLRVDKSLNLTKPGATRPLAVNVYFRVSNLLDRRNIISVYRYTGSPKDDGFLSSATGVKFLEGGIDPSLSLEAFLASYQWRLLNPDNYSLPRRMFLGAIIDF